MTDALRMGLSRRALLQRCAASGLLLGGLGRLPAFAAAPRRVVDLTHPIKPGGGDFQLERLRTYERDRANMNRWTVKEHSGTHLDAPLHFSGDGLSLAQIKAEDLVVPLAIIDITARAQNDPNAVLMPDDVKAWEARHGRLPDGCCVAMYSGWDKFYGTERYESADAKGMARAPGFHIDTAHFLLDQRKVKGLGVDSQSIDAESLAGGFPVHRAWLPTGRWAAEGLTNLGRVPPSGATMIVGALKVEGGSGGPSRVLALV